MPTLTPLREHARDVHSQFGEDGIIEEIFRRLGELDRPEDRPIWCVEFGAWDGVHLSNTRRLIEAFGAHAVLLEPDPERFRELAGNCEPFARVHTIRSEVECFGAKRLDTLLAGTPCPKAFDLLSIDIDGDEYWVWQAVRQYNPTIVVVEYNPTIPYEDPYISPQDPGQRHGSSLSAIRDLGGRKGYTLVAVTETNLVFVQSDRAPELRLPDDTIDELTEKLTDFRTFLAATPDGRIVILGNRVMMWHGVVLDDRAMQPLPWWLRRHHDALGPIAKKILGWLERRSRRRFELAIQRRTDLEVARPWERAKRP